MVSIDWGPDYDGRDFCGALLPSAARRLMKEWGRLESEPLYEQGIYHCFDGSLRTAAVLIIGPKDTPYAYGFYLFEFTFPNSYPTMPPHVRFQTGDGRVRFNPNLYQEGKVCLSILGTWPGPSWTSSCTLRTTALSLQSLLCSRPLQNEPGFESESGEEGDIYATMVGYENIAVSVMQLARPMPSRFIPLRSHMVQAFMLHFVDYIDTLDDLWQREGTSDECVTFHFATHYSPSKVQQDLRALFRTLLEDQNRSAVEGSVDFMEVLDADVPETEGRLPPSRGLDAHKWDDVDYLVPGEHQGLPPCQGLQERTKQLAREVVASAVARAMPAMQKVLKNIFADVDTDPCTQVEAMLPPSRGLPMQERRVASRVIAAVVARVLVKKVNVQATRCSMLDHGVHSKWSQLDADLGAFCSDCPICFDQINRPIALPCRHAFCADCLLRAVTQHGESSCPICRGALFTGAALVNEDDEDFYEHPFSEAPLSVTEIILTTIYFAPAVAYSLPLLVYMCPYYAFRSFRRWRQNMQVTDAEAMGASTGSPYEAIEQFSPHERVDSTFHPRSHLIPPLR